MTFRDDGEVGAIAVMEFNKSEKFHSCCLMRKDGKVSLLDSDRLH